MAEQIPANIMDKLHAQVLKDPELPRPNPTTAFWQLPPHPTLSEIQSSTLPSTTDYAIIGSGVTGCSIAKTLLEHSSESPTPLSVTVFEARTLTSGATGRNGGVLTSFVPGDYKLLSARFGHDQAVKIARFANRTLEKMHELANSSEELKEASEVRRLHDVVAFQDVESFREAEESWRLYEEHVPEERGTATFLSTEETADKYSMRADSGAIVFKNNGAFWPYRLITRVWEQLYIQYRTRLSLETKTPVTDITYDAATNSTHPYVLHTPRGIVRTSQIIHATNGYAGHLLPELRGKIYPLRGTMSTQVAPSEFGRHGHELSWTVVRTGNFDAPANTLELGLYYANQNPKTGDIFLGGEKAEIDEILVSDDSHVGGQCEENISKLLPKYFTRGWKEGETPEVRKVWSGIMGFTADRLPLVGKLPPSVTGRRDGNGEWIAAGFNGYGMPLCWSSGEAVAKMLVGIDVCDFLPEVFLPTSERLEDSSRMAVLPALGLLLSGRA